MDMTINAKKWGLRVTKASIINRRMRKANAVSTMSRKVGLSEEPGVRIWDNNRNF